MATRANIIKGLEILETYDVGGYCQAEHDEIHAGEYEVSPEDKKKLEALGFHMSEYGGWAVFT